MKRYYTSYEVMQMLNVKKGNYVTFGKLCAKLKLPRMKLGKAILFPVQALENRLTSIERARLKDYQVKEA